MHELPLVFFTVLGQSAVGAFIFLLLFSPFEGKQLGGRLFLSLCIFGVGLVIGVFHMGQLLRAMNLFLGVGRSPMSNEIILSALFGSVAAISALGLLSGKGSPSLFKWIGWLAAIVGFGFVVSIPAVYQLDTIVGWQTEYTWVVMLLTVLTCGGLIAATLGANQKAIWVSVIGVIVSLLIRPSYLSVLWNANSQLTSAQTLWFGFQVLLMLAVLIISLFVLVKRLPHRWIYLSTILIVASELLGRIAFYNMWSIPM
ncbi:dimethyl sulfoxide reductase anchor subunit family protein [Providencia alcalifaciens]